MMAKCARIIGTGSYLPKKVVTNEELKGRIKNFDEERAGMPFGDWVVSVTGVERRHYAEDEDTEYMAASAAEKALEAAGLSPHGLDFIIVSSFTPTRDIPNLGCTVAHLIGAEPVGTFPLNTACAGFIYGLAIAYAFIKADLYKNILVIASETLSKVTDFGDPKTAVLFGDGAGAAVLQAADSGGICSLPYLSSSFSDHFDLKNSNLSNACNILTESEHEYIKRSYIRMPGGPRVLRKAINSMVESAQGALDISPYSLKDVDRIIPHQANQRITIGLADKLEVGMDKVCSTIAECGNTSGASVAIALDRAIRGEVGDFEVEPGDRIVLTAVGGGYSLAGAVVDYC